jgi:hypothetical protein
MTLDRASAVELLDFELFRATVLTPKRTGKQIADDATVTLPIDVARLVLDCAQKGLRKGEGRGARRHTRDEQLQRQGIVAWARQRKKRLQAADNTLTAVEAELQAAEEAQTLARKRFSIRLAADSIRRMMQRADPDV